jgi:peptide/nickel transport system ATP-binding protein
MSVRRAPATRSVRGVVKDEPILRVSGLTVALRQPAKRTIVEDFSATVAHGGSMTIVGRSGTGKSLSVKAMLGLLDPHTFEVSGSVMLAGQDILSMAPRRRRRFISRTASLVFQNPTSALNPTMTVGRQIAEVMAHTGPRSKRISQAEAHTRAIGLMRDVGIANPELRFDAFPHQLSGGMRQRIVIAIALACNPVIMFCDEPTSSLDVTTQALVMDLLEELRRTRGIATVLVTHDLALASSRVDDVTVMHGGRVVESLPSAAFALRAKMPYTRDLIQAVPNSADRRLPIVIEVRPGRSRAVASGCSYQPYCEFADATCAELPPLRHLSEDHRLRCWHPVETGGTASAESAAETLTAERTTTTPAPASAPDERLAADSPTPLLEVRDLVRDFKVFARGTVRRERVSALAGVSFEVREGETLAIVGETGSGKSTLARSIFGATPAQAGDVVISGERLYRSGRRRKLRVPLGHLVQMVFQDPISALDPRWTVGRLVAEPLLAGPHYNVRQRRELVAEMLALVGLNAEEHGDRLAGALSGGEAQRVAIARALVSSPRLLICDEPVTALDVSVQAQIVRLLAELKQRLSLTYLLIAHDLDVVSVLADRVATMYLGRLCEVGPTEQIFAKPAHPYTAALISAIPPAVDATEEERAQLANRRVRLLGEPPSPTDPPSGCRFRTRCPLATELCAGVQPEMREIAPGHRVACHFPLIGAAAIELAGAADPAAEGSTN